MEAGELVNRGAGEPGAKTEELGNGRSPSFST